MKRQVPGLAEIARGPRPTIPDGIFLVRVDGAPFRWHANKPFYVLRLVIIEPRALAGQPIVGRLYCTQKAMWKLGWFLRDFLYDPELLAHEQVDKKALPGRRRRRQDQPRRGQRDQSSRWLAGAKPKSVRRTESSICSETVSVAVGSGSTALGTTLERCRLGWASR